MNKFKIYLLESEENKNRSVHSVEADAVGIEQGKFLVFYSIEKNLDGTENKRNPIACYSEWSHFAVDGKVKTGKV